jgi:two-component system osmolarity sensor histidine kinase EnvZ
MPSSRKSRRRFRLKSLFPSNLFARALLILVLPMLISQLIIAHIFYDRHWASVSRNMANSVVGDMAWLYQTYVDSYTQDGPEMALVRTQALGRQLNVEVAVNTSPNLVIEAGQGRRQFPEFYKGLKQRIDGPISLRLNETTGMVRTRIGMEGVALDLSVNRKLLSSSTTLIFLLWMAGTSLLTTLIAIVFLRNQVKPIVTLARAAERLGLGQDVADFKPRGASEVRRAGRAFLVMSERIRRHVQSRTEMLAGISHDLRTPLTRMKLELELATMDAATRTALSDDIDEMGKMIDEYLDFARGDAGELPEPMEVNWLLSDILSDYARSKRAVSFERGAAVHLMLRPQAIRRALTNLIDNALRYGGGVASITLEPSTTFVRIKVTDVGGGIPEAEQETVFKPFTRLEPSRNTQTGGVGLGLSIARAIAQSHGGDVTLENQRDSSGSITGLEVTLRLPRAVQPTP